MAQFLPNMYGPPPPPPVQMQPQQHPQVTSVQYVKADLSDLRPRRRPRIHRQVILLPTPEPIYRQVRHRMATPEREVIQRTFVQKANGDVIMQQSQPRKPRSTSRTEDHTQPRPTRARQVQTD